MSKPAKPPLYLCRINPACNLARFYVLSVQPTLFGGASLVRNWGRIGTKGRAKVETFDETEMVDAAFKSLERAKRRRGYVHLQTAGSGLPG
ncbi:WGR domain-containing protein [Arvimicrobium flavum]|uniref:WGR domain-containing protein n=1 Tax=Arvimicrobium flavum TaxID=3393320 RepID=UPI00237A303C|nr:WGR domain-containing protein [Mesorhizobium shangrilense]